jgi:tetratricopeptide (TPR) repeat protein
MSAKKKQEAMRLVEEGNRRQRAGDIDGALRSYERSIEIEPTAEGHTYLGWMLSSKGRIDEAIAHCRRAIEIDPDFGNPYNDIGAYLMQLGRMDEAEPWFRRAILAARYEPRQFPHVNLARLYIARHSWADAITELRAAMRLAPDDPTAGGMLRELAGRLNGSFATLALRVGSDD